MNKYRPVRDTSIIILKSFRLLRSTHYVGMAATGLLVSVIGIAPLSLNKLRHSIWNPEFGVASFCALASIFCAFQTLNLVNHFWDLKAGMDKKEFSTTFTVLSPRVWSVLTWMYGLASLVFQLYLFQGLALLTLALFYLIGFLYIIPPFRWKRWYPLSTFLLSIAALLAMVNGFVSSPADNDTGQFPERLALLIVVTMTFSFGTKDRKDWARDRTVGIKTLYTVYGAARGRSINAILVFLSYSSVPLLLGEGRYALLAVPFGLLSGFITISRFYYRESLIFICYYVFSVLLLGSIFYWQPGLLYWLP
ncbi:UbiA family prenyltransferase [candidate division CSSED10-310 bacterium]|uniref:UbiA family prenyltransferase n=1 Tax=candidate division CSSED10-310 bacterium TaxID=2855610 RepID=A0ABV6YWS0_UNCC1